MPSPPKVEKPRSMYNAASLAYIGDSIYEVSSEIIHNSSGSCSLDNTFPCLKLAEFYCAA